MKVVYDIKAIKNNILKAREHLGRPVVLMFKDFYEELAAHLPQELIEGCWSLHLLESNCYSLNSANYTHNGAIVISLNDAKYLHEEYGINRFYIPVNCGDDREGLTLHDAFELSDALTEKEWAEVYGLITSGCMNAEAPDTHRLEKICQVMCAGSASGVSLGGSYWIGREKLPDFISEVRIGEYMLFGTIPYCSDENLKGSNGVWIETQILAVYPERKQLLVDCGYKYADLSKCTMLSDGLMYVDSSSEYSIFSYDEPHCSVGDVLRFIPNYKSLVTLKDADTEYRE